MDLVIQNIIRKGKKREKALPFKNFTYMSSPYDYVLSQGTPIKMWDKFALIFIVTKLLVVKDEGQKMT